MSGKTNYITPFFARKFCRKYPNSLTVRVNRIYRIIHAIRIRADITIFLRQRVYTVPNNKGWVVHSRAIIVEVKPQGMDEHLAVVLVRLETGTCAHVPVDSSERIVLRSLLYRAVLTDYGTVVAEMILLIIMERHLTVLESSVAAIEEKFVEFAIINNKRTGEISTVLMG